MQLFKTIEKRVKLMNIPHQPFMLKPDTTLLALFPGTLQLPNLHECLTLIHTYMCMICTRAHTHLFSLEISKANFILSHITMLLYSCLICLEDLFLPTATYLRNSCPFSGSKYSITYKALPDFLSQTHPKHSLHQITARVIMYCNCVLKHTIFHLNHRLFLLPPGTGFELSFNQC